MPIAKVCVEVDQDLIREYLNGKMDEVYREALFTLDINEMPKRKRKAILVLRAIVESN